MVYVNYFFIKKSYIEYEKLVIACAAILLACKSENIQGKFDIICRRYLEFNNKIFGQCTTVLKADDIQKIKDKISLAELTLIRSLQFNITISLPNNFIYVYSAILYPDNEEDVVQIAVKVAGDSFYTYANLLYKSYVIAIASIYIAAKVLALPTILDQNFRHLQNMRKFANPPATEEEFNQRLLNFENKSFHIDEDVEIRLNEGTSTSSSNYFDVLEVNKKIHPYLDYAELLECIFMIMEYYEQCEDKLNK